MPSSVVDATDPDIVLYRHTQPRISPASYSSRRGRSHALKNLSLKQFNHSIPRHSPVTLPTDSLILFQQPKLSIAQRLLANVPIYCFTLVSDYTPIVILAQNDAPLPLTDPD